MGFKKPLKDDESYINGIGRLVAELDGDGEVKWFQNGKEIPQDASCLKFERVARENNRALIVKNCVKADFCKYAIEFNGEKSEAALKTMSPFTSKLENQSGMPGGIAVFACDVRPAVQVSWYFGDQKISKKTFSILKYEEATSGNTRKLLVKNITDKDFKNFSCEAKGEKCTAKLEKGPPKAAAKKTEAKPKSAVKDAKKDDKKKKVSPPEIKVEDAAFASKIADIRTQEGTIEVFKCKLKDEKQTVQWLSPKDKEINNKNYSILKFETAEEGAFRKLIVKNIQNDDAGQYRCQAGDSKISFKLNIGKGGAKQHHLQVDGMNLLMKRRGSKVDANKEQTLRKALERNMKDYKWVRHPDYMNLWIINPDFQAKA